MRDFEHWRFCYCCYIRSGFEILYRSHYIVQYENKIDLKRDICSRMGVPDRFENAFHCLNAQKHKICRDYSDKHFVAAMRPLVLSDSLICEWKYSTCVVGFRYLNYLLLLPVRIKSIDWLSRGADFVLDLKSAVTCLGVLVRRSTGDVSLLDSVLESGRKISINTHKFS